MPTVKLDGAGAYCPNIAQIWSMGRHIIHAVAALLIVILELF
jgi:hypothetical protein